MQTERDEWRDKNRDLLGAADVAPVSFVELVLAASECSEDESEIFDLVDDFVASGRVELAPLERNDLANV